MKLIHAAGRQAYHYGQSRNNPYAEEPYRAAWFGGYDEAAAEYDAWLTSYDDCAPVDCQAVFSAANDGTAGGAA